MKIVLAFDSFKGSMTAAEAVTAARDGVLAACPEAEVVCLPLADGGEGTTTAMGRCMGAEWCTCHAHDPLMRPIEAQYAISGQTAVMEMAATAGLTLLRAEERNPLHTTTYGVGEMIQDAIRRNCRHIIIGIGGSATNDGGMGMLAALGMRFIDNKGHELAPIGRNLSSIAAIDSSTMTDLSTISIDVVCDVTNPLYGPNGAAYIYAPQKGASASDVTALDNGLRHFAAICASWSSQRGLTLSPTTPGAGAAGGLGYALLLIGGQLKSGIDTILDTVGLDYHLCDADLVLTGEGKSDSQTLNGKLPLGILRRAQPLNIPVIVLAGQVEDRPLLLQAGFHNVLCINPPTLSTAEAMQADTAKRNLKDSAMHCLTQHIGTCK